MPPIALLESYHPLRDSRSFAFEESAGTIYAWSPADVAPALQQVQEAVASGLHAVGFVAYEAAPGLDPAMKTFPPPPGLPLVCLNLFARRRQTTPPATTPPAGFPLTDWSSSITRIEYDAAISRIREYIAQGDTYQVNYTFRRTAGFSGDPLAFYQSLCHAQRSGFCAFLDTGRHQILSVSPELFFRVCGREIVTRPMKGTAARGRWSKEDEAAARALSLCPKNRAENLMIVDLMRNDLGRVAEIGSVSVPDLFAVERYETVWQMTSTVRARLRMDVGLVDLFRALFPSGSVTGAPKIHTMEIIRELETTPRGVYTGCIGYVSPDGDMQFNVAIRTVVIDQETGQAECGVGGGITYDSAAESEYGECELKTRFLAHSRHEFRLLESFLHDATEGFFLLEEHLNRLAGSARYFGFQVNRDEIRIALLRMAEGWKTGRRKVRLLLDRPGSFEIESAEMSLSSSGPLRVCLASRPVNSHDPFLFHKTTRREVYDSRLAEHPGMDDVILQNEWGEITESTRANVVAEIDGEMLTPPLVSGLLPGVMRQALLEDGAIRERTLRPEDLSHASQVFLVNSVRKWMQVALVSGIPSR